MWLEEVVNANKQLSMKARVFLMTIMKWRISGQILMQAFDKVFKIRTVQTCS